MDGLFKGLPCTGLNLRGRNDVWACSITLLTEDT